MLSHAYNIITDSVGVAPICGKELVGGFSATDKSYSMLMKTVQLPGAAAYDLQIVMHTSTANTDVILARGFQNIFQIRHGHMACWVTVRTENLPVNGSGMSVSIISKT